MGGLTSSAVFSFSFFFAHPTGAGTAYAHACGCAGRRALRWEGQEWASLVRVAQPPPQVPPHRAPPPTVRGVGVGSGGRRGETERSGGGKGGSAWARDLPRGWRKVRPSPPPLLRDGAPGRGHAAATATATRVARATRHSAAVAGGWQKEEKKVRIRDALGDLPGWGKDGWCEPWRRGWGEGCAPTNASASRRKERTRQRKKLDKDEHQRPPTCRPRPLPTKSASVAVGTLVRPLRRVPHTRRTPAGTVAGHGEAQRCRPRAPGQPPDPPPPPRARLRASTTGTGTTAPTRSGRTRGNHGRQRDTAARPCPTRVTGRKCHPRDGHHGDDAAATGGKKQLLPPLPRTLTPCVAAPPPPAPPQPPHAPYSTRPLPPNTSPAPPISSQPIPLHPPTHSR